MTGTDADPVLTEDFSVPLPTKGGHDLSPVIGNTDRLWVTTNSRVYQFVKSTKQFDSNFPGHPFIDVGGVKSIGNQPSGQIVWSKPKKGIYLGWNTETVGLISPNGTRTKEGTAFYKSWIWNPNYQ